MDELRSPLDALTAPPPPRRLPVTTAKSVVTRRVLPDEEVALAIAAGGPLADLKVSPDKLKAMSVGVVEVDDQAGGGPVIVAYWVVWYALHAEPLWVKPEFRRHPAVISHVVGVMRDIVETSEEPAIYCQVEPADVELVAPYAERLGFIEAPGTFFYMVLPDTEKVEG